MRDNKHPGRVEDYTNAFLGTLWVILFMGLWVIAAIFGFLWAVITSALIDLGLRHITRSR
ncbi:hypothetical protein AB3Y40_12490 [Yoonia sp. R2331]|uniref:hypothetical protein n=1 Tax=Yoonia sp. R2331 TaxID=3237238 RepID=UPI0034E55233